MPHVLSVDVAIVGGGPGGAAAAIAIRRSSTLSVAILEKHCPPALKIGETLVPLGRGLLERLGVWQAFCAAGHRPSYGTCSAWGGAELLHRDFLVRPNGVGWHLDRSRFDEMLLAQAESHGAILVRPATVAHAQYTPAGWQLELRQPGEGQHDLRAKLVIDASGRRADFARQRGARKVLFDRLVGFYAFFAFDDNAGLQDSSTMVEAAERGWWYSALLPNQQLVVAYMTDADEARTGRLRNPECFRARVCETEHTKARLRAARMTAAPRVAHAGSQLLHPLGGEGWLAVGDAASSFDPLSSQGIVKALSGGLQIADVIRTGSIETYRQQVVSEFEQYLQTRKQYYRMETRWPKSPFWIRRHEKITVHPMQLLRVAALDRMPRLRMYMPAGDLELLARLCRQPCRAHELVTAFRGRVATAYSDDRIIHTIQYLVELGVLEYCASNTLRGGVTTSSTPV